MFRYFFMLALLAAAEAQAGTELRAWQMYSGVQMGALNDHVRRYSSTFTSPGNQYSSSPMHYGWATGLDAGWRFPWGGSLGLRSGWLETNPAEFMGLDPSTFNFRETDQIHASLFTLAAGGTYAWDFGYQGLSLELSAYGGWAQARARRHLRFQMDPPFGQGGLDFYLGDDRAYFETSAGLNWRFWKGMLVSLDAGWRMAEFPQLVFLEGNSTQNIKKGDVYQEMLYPGMTRPVAFDFSGSFVRWALVYSL